MDIFLSIFSSVQYGIALVAFVWMASIFAAPRLKNIRGMLSKKVHKARTHFATAFTLPIL